MEVSKQPQETSQHLQQYDEHVHVIGDNRSTITNITSRIKKVKRSMI